MTPEQCRLAIDLFCKRITVEEFAALSGMDPDGTPAFHTKLLNEALASGDAMEVECAISLVYMFRGWSPDDVPPLIQLLAAPWHTTHEDVARALQQLRDPRSTDALYERALAKLPYLDHDDSHALARKCVWALADTGTLESKARLESLATAEDETVAGYARKRLENWEAEVDRKVRHGTFIREPRAQVYECLLAVLATMAGRVLLVERGSTLDGSRPRRMSPEGERLRLQLEPSCTVASDRSEWPGTRLLEATAVVREYTIAPPMIALLQGAVAGLYEWVGDLEDLAFLRPDGKEMMFSIAHEKEGGLALLPEERDTLVRECPAIAGCIEWSDA